MKTVCTRKIAAASRISASVVLVSVVLAGCNSSPVASAPPGADPLSQRLGNLLAFNASSAPSVASVSQGVRVDCPIVQVEPGAASFRSATGDSAAGVRYQISIGEVARDCAMQGDRLTVRVGIETNTVLGPAGSPGTYTAPLRVTIRRQLDEAILTSKTYRVGGAVGLSGPAQYTLVADALSVPYINEKAADDYEVVVGFGEGPAPAGRRARKQ